jgi:hypothetical protein
MLDGLRSHSLLKKLVSSVVDVHRSRILSLVVLNEHGECCTQDRTCLDDADARVSADSRFWRYRCCHFGLLSPTWIASYANACGAISSPIPLAHHR